jgi:murein DD-endopeptidase MepM/ murein hydrolase activator NlpD
VQAILILLFTVSVSFLLGQTNVLESEKIICALPFDYGKVRLVTQGYFGKYSHQNEHAIDFRMRKGASIFAIREGVVIDLKEDEDRNFWKGIKSLKANYLVLLHSDGTYSKYMHMKKDGVLVELGDTVSLGQVIAYAGSTGNSTMSHLHLVCYKVNEKGQKITFPTLFETKKGVKELKAWHIYMKPKGD